MVYDRAIEVECPYCHSRPGEKCRDMSTGFPGEEAPGVLKHKERGEAWKRANQPDSEPSSP